MNAVLESRKTFWTRLAMSEFETAMYWRRSRRFKEARQSLKCVRDWLKMANANEENQ
jgi:hypothetical protein